MANRVLIVDDEMEAFGFLADIFEDYGYNTTMVDCGEKAIELIRRRFFDVALVDFHLPGVNGLEVFREIKKISPATSVIIMSAAPPEEMTKLAIEEGIFAMLTKPFKMEKILDLIDQVVKKTVVLIVDDQRGDREVLKDLLQQKGFKAISVKDGYEALEVFKRGEAEIALIDIMMPGIDGFTTLKKIKEICPDAGAIMMTAYTKEEYMRKAQEIGAFTCLYKPLDIEKISVIIEEIKKKKIEKAGRPSILLVEDDISLLKTLTVILEKEGYEVSAKETGAEAIKESKRKLYDAAIIDFKLPDQTGIDVVKKIKDVNSQTKIIFMTAYTSLDIVIDALREHVFDFLNKPVEPKQILRSLRKALKK